MPVDISFSIRTRLWAQPEFLKDPSKTYGSCFGVLIWGIPLFRIPIQCPWFLGSSHIPHEFTEAGFRLPTRTTVFALLDLELRLSLQARDPTAPQGPKSRGPRLGGLLGAFAQPPRRELLDLHSDIDVYMCLCESV